MNKDTILDFPAGTLIFKEGDAGDSMYIVKQGEVDLYVNGKIVETLGLNDFFGEMSLIDNEPRSATAMARTDCKLTPVNQKHFTYMVQQAPFFALKLLKVMSKRIRRSDSTIQ